MVRIATRPLLVLVLVCPAASRAEPEPPPKESEPSASEPPALPGDLGTDRKPVGANLVGGKYVHARGLGDRYSNALLNGVPLPSSDPDRRAVPLGALPPVLRSTVRMETIFTPDMPGDFAGGSLRLAARAFPEKLSWRLELVGRANTASSFRTHQTYPGGVDYFGFDDGTRAVPQAVPANQAVRIGEGEPPMSRDEVAFIARSFRNLWQTRALRVGMDHGFAAEVGGSERVGAGTFGHLASVSFMKSYRRLVSEIRNPTVERGKVVVREQFVEDEGKESTSWGGFLNLGYWLGARHRLGLVAVYAYSAADTAEFQTGRSESLGLDVQATRLRFVAQSTLFAMLEGVHGSASAGRGSVRWHLHYAHTSQDQPDMRDITYDDPGGGFGLRSVPGSGERFFATLLENGVGAGVDVTVPLGILAVKTGALARFARRSFLARRFWFELLEPALRFRPPEEIFVGENMGTRVRLDERTLPTDHYDADVQILAAYAMADVAALGPVRVTGGLRFEYYRQDLVSLNPLVGTPDQLQAARRSEADPMPALAVTWRVAQRMRLLGSYAGTISRPQLREIAPFKFFNFTRQRLDEGNPRLIRAYIHNADLRWEWAPRRELSMSVGVFYKYLSDPIERVIFDDRRSITYENAASAQAYGGELDLAADLGLFAAPLRDLGVALHVTLSDSRVRLRPEQVRIQTSPERPLQGQSPYLVDVSVGYRLRRASARLVVHYSVVGPRIVDVGANFLPDVFAQPFHRLDVRWVQTIGAGWTLTLAGGNVLNQPVSLRGGDVTVLRYRPGADMSLTIGYSG